MQRKTSDHPISTELSHDLMTPLQGVLGNVKLLLDTELDFAQREYAEMILDSAQALLWEVQSLLEPSPIQNETLVTETFPPDHFAGMRVLLAEDNVINQKVAEKTLQKYGMIVRVASNGLEALELLKSQPFDLILMDCQMPELDGYAATRKIRTFPIAIRNIPIIAMTANAVRGDRERCLQAGMNDYITKPFQLEELLSAVNRVRTPKA